jgi:hypothetical protein
MESKLESPPTPAQSCVATCSKCREVCAETVAYCLDQGGEHADARHISLMLSCMEICGMAGNVMAFGSDFYRQACALCADICEKCAADCDNFADDTMAKCAVVCRKCAERCRGMSAAA